MRGSNNPTESVRKWYRKVGAVLPVPQRIRRHVIAVDETKLKISGRRVFVWGGDRCRKIRGARNQGSWWKDRAIFFIKEVPKHCAGGRGKNVIESWFHIIKQKTKRFYNDFPFHSSMQFIATYLDSFVRM